MSAEGFDPYYKWLGIPPEEQPPTHYRLLGIVQFEADADVIANAATRQAFHLRQLNAGPQAALAQRLLKEVAAAKATLLNPGARAQYDQSLGPAVELPTDEIVPVPSFRKKPAKAKGFDLTPLLVRVVPVIAIAAIALFLLRGSGQKDVSQPDSVATSLPSPSDVVDNAEPTISPNTPAPISAPAQHPAVAAHDGNKQADHPVANPSADQPEAMDEPDSGPMRSGAIKPASAEPPAAEAVAEADMESESTKELDPTKEPVPSEADRNKASKLVRSKHKTDFAKAKTAEQKVALAKTLLAEGRDTDDDPADRYALAAAAIDLAVAAGDFQLAVDGWNELGEHFQVDALAGQWKVLEKSFNSKQDEALKATLQQFVEDSIDRERYDLARGALKALLAMSKPEDTGQYEADLKNLDALAARSAAAKSALERLKTNPADPQANQTAGEFLSFFQRDWSRGLLLLSRSSDATLKGLARDELGQPSDAKLQVRLADAWWSFAEGQSDEKIKASAKARARFWYMEALPELQGDAREKAEKRATLEARVHRESMAGARISPQLLASKFQGKATYDAEIGQLTLAYDFQNPAQLKDFEGDAKVTDGEIDVPLAQSVRHVVKFKTLKMTGTVTMKSQVGDVVCSSGGLQARRDAASVKVSSGSDAASSSEKGPADDDLVLPFEIDANEKLVLFRLGDEVVGKPMAKSEPGQFQLCGGEAGAQFSQLTISGEPDPTWLAEFFGLRKAQAEATGSAGKSAAAAKSKSAMKFGHIAKVVLWNEHNAQHNNSGAQTCNLILSRSGKNVWQKKDLEIPWQADQPTRLIVDVPQVIADSVRVEITAWHGESAGLAEVEVLDKADKNLAAGAQVFANAEHRPGDPRNAATLIDGINDSQAEKAGYWLAPIGQPAWADIRLLPQEAPTPQAPAKVQAGTSKEPAKVAGKTSRKSLDAKIFATCDDAFEMCVNGVAVLDGKENELFSAGAALAAGDVITVKARNEAGLLGFCCVIRFSNGQMITTSDGWKAYRPLDLVEWGSPKGIRDPVPAVLGDSGWGMSAKAKTKFGVDADEIWAPGKEDTCYLFYVVGPIDIPKKKLAK